MSSVTISQKQLRYAIFLRFLFPDFFSFLVGIVCPRCRTLMETLNTRLISLLLSSNLIKLRNESEMCSQVQSLQVTDKYLLNGGHSLGEKPNGENLLSCAQFVSYDFLIINLLSPRHAITFQCCYTTQSISRMRLQGDIS